MTRPIAGVSGILALAVSLLLLWPIAEGQVLREYIRFGDRVVAIETTALQTAPEISLSPTPAATSAVAFVLEAVSTEGGANIRTAGLLINHSFDGVNACHFFIDTAAQTITLFNDNGVDPLTNNYTLNTTGAPALSNLQCSITTPVTASVNDKKLVWNVSVTFKPAFSMSGSRNVYGYVATASGATETSALTTWDPNGVLPTMPGAKVGIFRDGYFWILDLNGNTAFDGTGPGQDTAFAFGGVAGDIPIAGDWNGDGRAKVGVYRPVNGLFVLDYNGDRVFDAAVDKAYDLGVGIQPGDTPVVGDWNGDGRTKVGLFRQGYFWILDTNGNGVFQTGVDTSFAYGGVSGDLPVTGDWSGNGKTKVGVFRLDTSGWWTRMATTAAWVMQVSPMEGPPAMCPWSATGGLWRGPPPK